MKVIDYGGRGMCGPRVLLRTRDENLARKHLNEIIDFNVKNFDFLSKEVLATNPIDSVTEAYQNVSNFKLFLTDNTSTSLLLAYAASPLRKESYVVHYGNEVINVGGEKKEYTIRHLKASNTHWQELVF